MQDNNESEHEPIQPHEIPSNAEIFESAKQMIGDLAPFISFGVGVQEAATRAAMSHGDLDYPQSVHAGNQHLNSRDPAIDAVAVLQVGMSFLGMLRAGVSPSDAGICAFDANQAFLGLDSDQKDAETDY